MSDHESTLGQPSSESFSYAAELQAALATENSQTIEGPVTDLEHDIQQTLEQRHPDWPNVTMHIHFAAHENAADMSKLPGHIETADVYFFENATGNDHVGFFQSVADHTPNPDGPAELEQALDNYNIRHTRNEPIFRGLYYGKAVVGHIDLRPDDIPGEDLLLEQINENMSIKLPGGSFDDRLEAIEQTAQRWADAQSKREDIMVERFETELASILHGHPELMGKESLRVVLSMGAAHTALGRKMEAAGITTERSLPQKPFVYSHFIEVERGMAHGLEPSRDLLARTYLSGFIDGFIGSSLDDAPLQDRVRYVRRVVDSFNVDEIESIDRLKLTNSFSRSVMNRMIQEKGLEPIPNNATELKAAVQRIRG
jgi:hypothetical protein